MRKKRCFVLLGSVIVLAMLLAVKTSIDVLPLPARLAPEMNDLQKVQYLTRNGTPLSVTYQNPWNFHECSALHEMPPLLVQAFIESEDKRFFRHGGVDWLARIHACVRNLLALRAVRGASTISEQVVRMLHPRPRTVWSRWLEGVEAQSLEKRFPKGEILEFYLNQVPYAHQRRGVNQAARLYFDRDLESLNPAEILALAVLVRAPTRMDLWRSGSRVKRGADRLAVHLRSLGHMSEDQVQSVLNGRLSLEKSYLSLEAGHFVQFLHARAGSLGGQRGSSRVLTTLDEELQSRIQKILDTRLRDLGSTETVDGAVLVVDHARDEILAWVNGGGLSDRLPGGWIDAVLAPRQPGSTLKPFLYALALEKGWTAATLIEDAPLSEPIGTGLHTFHNYSRTHYGLLRLRDALGNSLNIPAVRAIQFTGRGPFMGKLHELGFQSLDRPVEHYGDGLALGDGEVSLYELVRAYGVLARGGEFRPLRVILHDDSGIEPSRRVFQPETAALIGDILSDAQARRLEFGDGHLLRFPLQTSVKTGTSSDHRDAWAVGFSRRHTAGVWIGNLDRKPTRGLTGASGPALVLRAAFAEIDRLEAVNSPVMPSQLSSTTICRISGLLAAHACPTLQEYFRPGQAPQGKCPGHESRRVSRIPDGFSGREATASLQARLVQPTADLQIRMDPRIPDDLEAFPFTVSKDLSTERIEWSVDGRVEAVTGSGEHRYLWRLSRGRHVAHARIWKTGCDQPQETPPVPFTVK